MTTIRCEIKGYGAKLKWNAVTEPDQLPPAPMMILALRVEYTLGVPVQRLHLPVHDVVIAVSIP